MKLKQEFSKVKSWVPVHDSAKNVMDMEGAVVSEHIPKLCDCLKGECEIVDEADVQQEQDKAADLAMPNGEVIVEAEAQQELDETPDQ